MNINQKYDVIDPSIGPRSNHLHPIIFLHGIIDCRRTWKKVAPAIARITGRKAYIIDARNHGESPRHKEMNYEVLTQDVLGFMDDHNIRKAVIVGHSMGGRTAINFSLKYPERIEALVVEDMTPKNVRSSPSKLLPSAIRILKDLWKSIPPTDDLNTAKRHTLDLLLNFANERYVNAEKVNKHYDLDMMPVVKVGDSVTAECDLDAVESMLEADALVQDLPEKNLVFHGDVLFIYGDLGFFNLAKHTGVISKLFPRAVIKKIKGASHVIHVDSPDLYTEVVSHFILHGTIHPEAKY